jgi:hypothetical protein
MTTHPSLSVVLAILGHALLSQNYIVAGWSVLGLAVLISVALIVFEEWMH